MAFLLESEKSKKENNSRRTKEGKQKYNGIGIRRQEEELCPQKQPGCSSATCASNAVQVSMQLSMLACTAALMLDTLKQLLLQCKPNML